VRKRLIVPDQQLNEGEEQWLDPAALAEVNVTSESSSHPVEAAIMLDGKGGWRAADTGSQTIRLVFDRPLSLKRIRLVFEEHDQTRSHEFVLGWSSDGSHYHEIVRQQWSFSPPGTVREVEDYRVNLLQVKMLELVIVARDISNNNVIASLEALRLA
jgi:hypothetical protein